MKTNKPNKKGEVRIQHMVTAVLVMSLFGIYLFSMTNSFITNHSNGTITNANLTDAGSENRSAFYTSIENLENRTSELTTMGKSAPGGAASTTPTEGSGDTAGGFILSGFKFISSIGKWLFEFPVAIIKAGAGFFGLPSIFGIVGATIFIIMVVIILISSILKNRI